jgi:hypothetical protein
MNVGVVVFGRLHGQTTRPSKPQLQHQGGGVDEG